MMFDPTMIENTLGFWLNRTAFLMRADLVRRFGQAGFDITAEEFAILNRVSLEGGPTQTRISEQTFKDKTTTTRFVDRLEGKGLVERRRDPADGRRVRVGLTAKGGKVRAALVPIAQGLIADTVEGIPADQLAATMAALRRMTANLTGESAGATGNR